MRRLALSFIGIAFIFALVPASAARAQGDCGLETRLEPGTVGRVLPGDANRVRAEPRRDAAQRDMLPGGFYFMTLEGVACAGGFTWREIEYGREEERTHGWTAESNASEYFLETALFQGEVISHGGISLVIPDGLPSDVEIEIRPADVRGPQNQVGIPASVIILLVAPDMNDIELRIFRTDGYNDGVARGPDYIPNMFEGAFGFTVNALDDLLDERPEVLEFDVIRNRPPDLAPGAAQGMLAYLGLLDFQNGAGLRFITYYQQMFSSPGRTVLYRFNGLTDNRRYLIEFETGVMPPRQAPEYNQAEGARSNDEFAYYQDYAARIAAFYDAIPPDQWTPNLEAVNALIESLVVGDVSALADDGG